MENNLFKKAEEALEKGNAILAKFKDAALPEAEALEVKALFNEAEEYQEKAARELEKKALEEKAHSLAGNMEKPINRLPIVENNEGSMDKSYELYKKSLGTYLRKGRAGMDVMEYKALASNSDADGGIFVHAELQNQIIRQLYDVLQLRQLATVVNTSKGSIPFPTFEFTGTISNVAEGATVSAMSISNAFGKQTFTPHKKSILFKIPDELIEDSDFDIVGHMVNHFVNRFAEELEDDIISGTGVNESLGLLNANLTAADLTSSATNINTLSVLEAPTKLKLQYRRNGAYIMSRDQVEEANKLVDTTGRPLFREAANLVAGQPDRLNRYPLIEVERMTAPAADGDCSFIFGDMKYYWIVERKAVTIKQLGELYAVDGQVGFLVSMRVDGSPVLQEAFIRYNRN